MRLDQSPQRCLIVIVQALELNIIERAWENGWVKPIKASKRTGKSVAVVGSGPAGLAAAQQLTRAGHDVTVFERADRVGGLLRYGIPEFKMEKWVLDRRLAQMAAEGTQFKTNAYVGGPEDHPDRLAATELAADFDSVVLAGGATDWRDLPIAGRELDGVHQAMEYLPFANRVQEGDLGEPPISAEGKAVVIIGGGDTGADCLGTANRQRARTVYQLEIMPQPPDHRSDSTPWPTWPLMMRTSSAHEEGVQRLFAVSTTEFVGSDGAVTHLRGHRVDVTFENGRPGFQPVDGSDFELEAELVLLAMGFTGPETNSVIGELELAIEGGRVKRDSRWRTSHPGVFTCGDMGRGQSLIVWAIAEGRACAASVDAELMGSTLLPSPVRPTDRPLS